jgi:mannose-6-phosphate isomerase
MQSPKPYREKRPWGEFVEFTRNTPSTVKIITINAGEAFSLQKHSSRDEFWKVLDGQGKIFLNDKVFELKSGDEFFVEKGTLHRVEAGSTAVRILEISFGNFDEKDITRVEDRYGRSQ